MEYDTKIGMWHRGRGDVGIWKEQRHYKLFVEFLKTIPGPILDLGGHIGCFVKHAADHGLNYVVSVEPDPANILVFEKNHPGTPLIKAAVIDSRMTKQSMLTRASKKISLYLGKTYLASNSLENFKGREQIYVDSVEWATLLEYEPWVGIKCDIEGGEYGLNWADLPETIRSITFEFHYFRPDWLEKQKHIHNVLTTQRFIASKEPKFNSFTKSCMATYMR